jgi:tRNA nucleotidyltransferase/poly(A) polymerase
MTLYDFALEVVTTLQQAGHQALFAGGCVRDQLLGLAPKDYDVATSARPEQVRELFGKQRTLPIGASFGVITVLGPKEFPPIEVATFRRDAGYSDGRRPDRIEFTDAREDALRRDFTINGIFFDPISQTIHDFVDGRRDLEERRVRAIGNPLDRIAEDKLRMLRAVRFSATFDFELEPETHEAVRRCARDIGVVSGERIAAEMRRMMMHRNRDVAAQLLAETELLREIAPRGDLETRNRANWRTRIQWMRALGEAPFETAINLLLMNSLKELGPHPVADRWKLSNAERKTIGWIHDYWLMLSRGASLPWSEIQPLLIHPDATSALHLAETVLGSRHVGVEFCRRKLSLAPEVLNPPELIDGKDLIAWGFRPGPTFSEALRTIRARQLDGEIHSVEEARAIALDVVRHFG